MKRSMVSWLLFCVGLVLVLISDPLAKVLYKTFALERDSPVGSISVIPVFYGRLLYILWAISGCLFIIAVIIRYWPKAHSHISSRKGGIH